MEGRREWEKEGGWKEERNYQELTQKDKLDVSPKLSQNVKLGGVGYDSSGTTFDLSVIFGQFTEPLCLSFPTVVLMTKSEIKSQDT